MNLAHLHLLLNHIPVLGIPFGLLLYASGVVRKNDEIKRFAYFFTVAIALIAIPTYLTGEPAEELVEHLPGVAESLIKNHEEAAEVSLVLVLIAGALGGIKLLVRWSKIDRLTSIGFGIALVVSAISLGYTANIGGEIRHTEIRATANGNQTLNGESENKNELGEGEKEGTKENGKEDNDD
jgi:uncharacterized membrane protein